MNLTVEGYGFAEGNITATVDGKPCEVISQFQTSFSCLVYPSESVSISNASYVGSNGMIRHFINETNWIDWNRLESYNHTRSLVLSLESPYAEDDKIASIYKGWFVAPATTNYRFYIACDDYCSIDIGDTPNQVENVTRVVENLENMNYRDWWETRGGDKYKRISDWISLQ
jgi:hypothetical protein